MIKSIKRYIKLILWRARLIRSIVLLFALSISFAPTNVQADERSDFEGMICGLAVNVPTTKSLIKNIKEKYGVSLGYAMRQAQCITFRKHEAPDLKGTVFAKILRYRARPNVMMKQIFKQLIETEQSQDRKALIHLITGSVESVYNDDIEGNIFEIMQNMIPNKLFADQRKALLKTYRFMCKYVYRYELEEVYTITSATCVPPYWSK